MEKTKSGRKSYRPPEIRKVALVVEEAVLQACKTPSEQARRTGPITRVCGSGPCRLVGS